ncbi:Metal-dependent hydrolase, endonuclease/exonuclease/phosphatase family [Singulisphaera sp. GP187]|uniref:endonuclease/exonuclease/phosphatase family protein n=1 Tax=Singulisphaera sp. GP187 TaxID=1882752 RepID=UPI000928B805|nr:endonuclease/exonuclease/phosphatase family protein [Singulisphaera sp. GP187]SIO56686.1 Metal-dependent hydrolase, endonuclease/exonuclease/phosphatase family [Singulisphaera sp. GP187]
MTRFKVLLTPLLMFAAAGVSAVAAEPTRIRILSYNIHHGEGTDQKVDLERLARVILSVKPDVVALQEVDRGVKRTNKVDEPAELGRLTGMRPIFERNIIFEGGDYGNAILSGLPVTSHKNIPLPSHYVGEQRGALVAELTAPDGRTPFRFIATHLDYRGNDGERRDSVKRLEEVAREAPDRPTLLVGDLNSLPDSEVLTQFEVNWKRSTSTPLPTFPSDKPTRQIDYVLFRPASRWKVVENWVLDEPVASDHRPLLVVLELVN